MAGATKAPLDRSKIARAGKYVSTDDGAKLDSIAGQEVVIIGVQFDARSGRKNDAHPDGKFTMNIITLEDGTIVHTGSDVIRDQLEKLSADPGFPVLAIFGRIDSASNRGQSYWSILPDTDETE